MDAHSEQKPVLDDIVVKEEDDNSDVELELEAALAVEDEPDVKPNVGVELDRIGTASISAPAPSSSSAPAPAPIAADSTSTPFKLPPNPSMPQDLSIIMEMVANNAVVGSLPPVSMTAAEKRKLVEASLREKKDKGKGKETEGTGEGVTVSEPGQAVKAEPGVEVNDVGSASDSSSEFESSSEEESENEAVPSKPTEPLTQETHDQLKKELDEFVKSPEVEVDSEYESEPDSDSDEEMGGEGLPNLSSMGFEFMDDEEDDAGASGGAAITSVHEAPLPPVALPPMEKIPKGEGVSLAGDVVSWMREKKVEAWLEKKAKEDEEQAHGQAQEGTVGSGTQPAEPKQSGETTDSTASAPVTSASTKSPVKTAASDPKFTSAGTVVVRAMQSRPGAADEGWLEEGSVLCWEDGKVLGTVHETFGPLTSPFYTIRLPPPPFPYPAPEQLASGTRLFYPLNPSYRSFVNMLAVRDPRFKGSDASNLYDEEIAEDEMEWSDDEAEAEAKKRRKQRRAGSKTPSVAGGAGGRGGGGGGGGGGSGHFSLPARPHFDYQPDDASETGSLYGDDDADKWENMSVSDVGSTASTRGRPKPAPYDVEYADDSPAMSEGASGRGGRGKGGRGRGQGRERGGGRGRGRGTSGGARGRGGRRPEGSQPQAHDGPGAGAGPDARQGFALPPNPMAQFQGQQQQQQQPFAPFPQPPQPYAPFPQQNNFAYPPQSNVQYPPPAPFNAYQYPQHAPPHPQQGSNEAYEPHRPSAGMPSAPAPAPAFPAPYSGQHGPGPGVGGVAINPRFAAQYQQMMNMGMNMGMMGQPPAHQGQGQGQGQGYGWQGQGNGPSGYSE